MILSGKMDIIDKLIISCSYLAVFMPLKNGIQETIVLQSVDVHNLESLGMIGEYEEGKKGRSSESKKRLVVIALEVLKEGGVGRAYAQVIDSASAKEFKPFFNAHISKEASIVTDEWKGYLPLRKEYPLLRQLPSNKANFKQLHIHIMNIQGWLRGIHHHCTKERLQGYLDEYHCRYNRRNHMGSIFDSTIERMVFIEPKRLIK